MKTFSKQYYFIFGRLFILLLLALCLFDFGVQGVAADNSVETSALVIDTADIAFSSNYELQVDGDTDVKPVDGDDFDFDHVIKWFIKKFPKWLRFSTII